MKFKNLKVYFLLLLSILFFSFSNWSGYSIIVFIFNNWVELSKLNQKYTIKSQLNVFLFALLNLPLLILLQSLIIYCHLFFKEQNYLGYFVSTTLSIVISFQLFINFLSLWSVKNLEQSFSVILKLLFQFFKTTKGIAFIQALFFVLTNLLLQKLESEALFILIYITVSSMGSILYQKQAS